MSFPTEESEKERREREDEKAVQAEAIREELLHPFHRRLAQRQEAAAAAAQLQSHKEEEPPLVNAQPTHSINNQPLVEELDRVAPSPNP